MACGPADEVGEEELCEAPLSQGMALQVGTGETEFISVAPTDSIPIIFGPQGGTHLWIALRVQGADETSRVELEVRSPDGVGAFGGRTTVTVNLGAADAEGWRERAGLFGFLDDPEQTRGQRVSLWARVGDCRRGIQGEAVGIAE